jgi:polysaccharide biosynthesis/export protein
MRATWLLVVITGFRPVSLLLALMLSVQSLAAQPRIEAGEVLELSVIGVPELRQRVTVDRDGGVSFALVGRMNVVGLSVPELASKLGNSMASKVFRHRTTDGRETAVTILPEEVTVEVVEYRPIYLTGDVSRPGELKYRPGMTVRQAVSLGGGYDFMRLRLTNPVMEAAGLWGDYQALWAELISEQVHARRLETELTGKPNKESDFSKAPVPANFIAEIKNLEADQQRAHHSLMQKEKTALNETLRLIDDQLVAVVRQQEKSGEGTKAELELLADATKRHNKGISPLTSVLDARRSLMYSSNAFFQATAQISGLGREREELKRKLQSIDDQRRLDLVRELQVANVKLAAMRARLDAVRQRLIYSSQLRSQLLAGGKPDIQVFRNGEGGWARSAADEDSEVFPGDVIEVALRSEHSLSLSGH